MSSFLLSKGAFGTWDGTGRNGMRCSVPRLPLPPPPPPLPQTQLHLPRPQRSLHHRLTFWGVRGGSSSSSSHLFSLPLPFPVAFPSSSPVAVASPGSISIFSLSSCISRFDLDLLQESLHLPVCNYAKGKWVVDHKKLLYSGHGCKQCLSSMWSCRMTKCTDFSYEKVSWQPKDCQMEEFEGYKFLKRLYESTDHNTMAPLENRSPCMLLQHISSVGIVGIS
ncbi:hypothetical protein DVH24_042669 [Malus domestica]|uniref:Trichome birefringence-like N-terminal domain-containing protein n=1 Tax=Malus domestica TaxID=3750 RepID=A0A498I0V4_MALDO|nr:hypothetical protein DVH24_042669 [Malus domestica]